MFKRKLSTVLREYGPFQGPLTKKEAEIHLNNGNTLRILNICDSDTRATFYGSVGHHIVNVQERYLAAKPMPEEMLVYDIWFVSEGEEGLRHP